MTLAASPQSFDRRIVLDGVSWDLYEHLLAEIGERPIHLTFDEGRLEIMTLSDLHERVKKIIARLIEAYGDAIGVDIEGLGSTTFRREELQKGLEPDECYYVAHAAMWPGKEEFDLAVDPPPDLAIEIDISPPDVARQPIYAALGVPEVWRYDGSKIAFLRRNDAGTGYVPSEKSLSFPDLPMEEFSRFIQIGLTSGQPAAVRALRQWLRSR
jgi:Uma2 family endonuclease